MSMSYFVFHCKLLIQYVSCSGPLTSVGEERANLSATVYF